MASFRRNTPEPLPRHQQVSLVSLAYPSEEAKLTDHVGKGSFIIALNDEPLQMEVMKVNRPTWKLLSIMRPRLRHMSNRS